MTGLVQSLHDTLLIVRTDKRIWSASAFLSLVLLIWAFTGSWREPEPPKAVHLYNIKPEQELVKGVMANIQKDLDVGTKGRAELQGVMKRTESDLAIDQQKIDWHLNSLVDKLDHMATRIDKIAKDVGGWSIEQSELDRKIALQNKKGRQVNKHVDASEFIR